MKLKLALSMGIVFTIVFIAFSSFQKTPPIDLKSSIARGKEIYFANCITCHMPEGEGIEGIYPPLAKSDYLMADKNRSILQVLNGMIGEMKVNGKVYNGVMTGYNLTDNEVSDLLNYVRNSFGNKGPALTPEDVKVVRNK